MEITKSSLFYSLHCGTLRVCFTSQIGVAFWLLHAGCFCIWAVWMFIAFLFSFWLLHVAYESSLWHASFSEGVPVCSISYFNTCDQSGSQMSVPFNLLNEMFCSWTTISISSSPSVDTWGGCPHATVQATVRLIWCASTLIRGVFCTFLFAVCRWTECWPTMTWTKILWSMLPFRLW